MANFKTARTVSDKTAKYAAAFPSKRSNRMSGSTEKRGSVKSTKMTGS